MNMKNLEPAKIPAKVPASDLFSSNQGKQLFNKVWNKINPVFFILTTRELSMNRKDLKNPTLAGPPLLWMNEWMNEWKVYSLKFSTFMNESSHHNNVKCT